MLALSDVVLVTEDSISMVSEALRAGKRVVVMQLGNGKLPRKHSRFHEVLRSSDLIHLANAADFRQRLTRDHWGWKDTVLERESQLIQQALRKLL